MKSFYEFEPDLVSFNYIHSFIYISHESTEIYNIYPDGADYIIFSSDGTIKILKKSKLIQELTIDDECLLIFRLKPYTLKMFENSYDDFITRLDELSILFTKTKSLGDYRYLFSDLLLSGRSFYQDYYTEIASVNTIMEHKGDITVEKLSTILDIPERTIQKRFKKNIEITPKEYINIIRFQSLITKVSKFKFNNLSKEQKRYVDYSHFYKEFKKYTKLSPNQFYQKEEKCFKSLFDIPYLI